MGTVYAARNIELDKEVAIKMLHPDVSAIPDYVTRFRREAKACASLRSEHVARVYDVGTTDDGVPYMVMELLEGEDLESLLERKHRLPAEEAVDYVLQACEGIAEAHRARLIHRDLKPANLFLARGPGRDIVVKVVDFGIVKQLGASEIDALTKDASMMGTVLYMAPENLRRKKDVDERVDIWALGVVLYELVTGKVPFGGDTMPEVVAKVLDNDYVPASDLVPTLPKGLSEVIATALSPSPADRYLTVTELAQALLPFAGSKAQAHMHFTRISSMIPRSEEAPSSGAPRRSEIRQLKRRPKLTARVVGLVAVLFCAAFAFSFYALKSRRVSVELVSPEGPAEPNLGTRSSEGAPPPPSPSAEVAVAAPPTVASPATPGSASASALTQAQASGTFPRAPQPVSNPLRKMQIK